MSEESVTLLRAIRLPVILITLGTLAALDQFSIVPLEKSWPLVLIVAGLLALGSWSKRSGQL